MNAGLNGATAKMVSGQLVAEPGHPIKIVETNAKADIPISENQRRAQLIGKSIFQIKCPLSPVC